MERNTHKNSKNQPQKHIKMGLKREFQPQSGAGCGIRTHVPDGKRFSRPPRYDHFDNPACILLPIYGKSADKIKKYEFEKLRENCEIPQKLTAETSEKNRGNRMNIAENARFQKEAVTETRVFQDRLVMTTSITLRNIL